MSIIFGPSDTVYTDGYCNNPTTVYSGPIASGAVITCSWSGVTWDSGTTHEGGFYLYAGPFVFGTTAIVWSPVGQFNTAGPQSFTFTTPTAYANAFLVVAGGGGAACSGCGCAHGVVNGFTVDMSPPPVTVFCSGGTERKDVTTDLVVLGGTLIDLIDASVPSAWLTYFAILANALGVHVLSTNQLCSGLPPAMPEGISAIINQLNSGQSPTDPRAFDKILQAIECLSWPYFCQCVAGGTTPPAPTNPTDVIVLPQPVLCDGNDPCAILNSISNQIMYLSMQVSYLRTDVTLIQRQKVPFSYVAGNLHVGLTGAGQISVQGILAVAVQVTTVPAASGEEAGNPIARFGLGWVTTGTADGWRRALPIRSNPQWVDVEPDDTLVGYSLEPLVVANLQEFVREP